MTLELIELIDTLNDVSSLKETDFGGYELILKSFISGMLDKMAPDNLTKKLVDFKIQK